MQVWISGIGISAPGIPDWESAAAIIRDERPFEAAEYRYRDPQGLSGAERRRCPASVKLALDVAEQARTMSGRNGSELAAVFGSMTGDGPIIVRSLTTLADDPHFLSPTDFHNSVHNAAVGYWAIATGSQQGATSLTAAENSFPIALMKAAMQALSEDTPVLMCVYDVPFPPPLDTQVAVSAPFGSALVLHGHRPANALASLELSLGETVAQVTRPAKSFWLDHYESCPAARIIPMAERLAAMRAGDEAIVRIGDVGSSMLTARLAP